MKVKKNWQKRFAKSINHTLRRNTSLTNREIVIIKDVIYLLGEAIDETMYSWNDGFNKFCDDLGINLK